MSKSLDSTNLVIAVVAFSQGVLGLADLAISFMQKENFQMQPAEMTYIQGIISFPWVVKPIWGLCTDMFPICQYRRKSYLFIFGILQCLLWNFLAEFGVHDKWLGVATLISIQICVSFCNVVGEALLVEASGKNANSHATKNVSIFFGIKALGTLLTAYFSGYSLRYLKKEQIFRITSFFPMFMALTALKLAEQKVNMTPRQRVKNENFIDKDKTIAELRKFLTKPIIFKPIIFIFVFMLAPAQGTAMFYFYTGNLGFTSEFLGKLRFFQAFGHIFSVLLYNRKLKEVSFKKIFAYSTIGYFVCSFMTLVLVTRENVRIGLPDKPFCLTDTVIVHIIGELNTLPILVLACKICPSNIEGTMYALLMSTINLGQLLGKQIGGILMYYLGITDSSFDNLWILVLIHSCYMLVPLPFLSTVKEDEMMKVKEEEDDTSDNPQNYVERFSAYEKLSLSVINDSKDVHVFNQEEVENLLDGL